MQEVFLHGKISSFETPKKKILVQRNIIIKYE